jgi:hypothetical protein
VQISRYLPCKPHRSSKDQKEIVPGNMDEVLLKGSRDEIQRVTAAFLKMKKFDIDKVDALTIK